MQENNWLKKISKISLLVHSSSNLMLANNKLFINLLTTAFFILTFSLPTCAKSILFPSLLKNYNNDITYCTNQIRKDWKLVVGTATLISASFFADKGIKSYVIKHKNRFMDHFTDYVKPLGNGFLILPVSVGLGTIGYYSKDARLFKSSYTSVESILTTSIITGALKITIGRKRPCKTNNPFIFKPFNMSSNYQSFPSGDVSTAWAFITPYAIYYHQPLLYLIPLSVSVERIYNNDHWTSDTLIGTAIGFSIGYLFSESHLNKNFSIYFNGSSIGISWRFK